MFTIPESIIYLVQLLRIFCERELKVLPYISLNVLPTFVDTMLKNNLLNMDKSEVLTFLGIILCLEIIACHTIGSTGQIQLMCISHWSLMRHNRFAEIMRDLHFADNTNMSMDRYYKVYPLFEELIGAFKQADISENISIDETMIPYMIPLGHSPGIACTSVKLPKCAGYYCNSVQVHL